LRLFLCHTHISTFFIDLSCHVVCFSRRFHLRFWHSLHCSSHFMIFIVSSFILLSFCAFRILEYLLIGIFFEILCMKILLCLCAGLILIYLCLMNCCIGYNFLWNPFDSRHKYHIVFWTNRIWFFLVMVFLEIFLFNFGLGICHPTIDLNTVSDR
jgi:hypothetical protein